MNYGSEGAGAPELIYTTLSRSREWWRWFHQSTNLGNMIEILSSSVNTTRWQLLRILIHMLNQLPAHATIAHTRIGEEVMQVDLLLDAGCRQVRVPMNEADDFLRLVVGRYGTVHADFVVEEAGEGTVGYFGGDGAFVEDIVLFQRPSQACLSPSWMARIVTGIVDELLVQSSSGRVTVVN